MRACIGLPGNPCGVRVAVGNRCPQHLAEHEAAQADYNRRRGSATDRGYDSEYQRARRQVLEEELVCSKCGHEGTADDPLTVHHIIPVEDGGRSDRENLTARHRGCHPRGPARRRSTVFA